MGAWEGHAWQEVSRLWPEEFYHFNRRIDLWQPEGGENARQVLERYLPALEEVARAHDGETIALRTARTDERGAFRFTALAPGEYALAFAAEDGEIRFAQPAAFTLAEGGARCVLLVVIQMKGVSLFRPNWETQPEFGRALLNARAAGVEIVAMDCETAPGMVRIDRPVEVRLEQ